MQPTAAPLLTQLEVSTQTLSLLGSLTTAIDRLSATDPLHGFPSLRDQLRRSALEALSHAARALEPVPGEERRRLFIRALGALYELETLSRVAAKAGALSPDDSGRAVALVREASHQVRGELERLPARA